ncbi:MAG: hypothetical protein JO235_03955 [Chroococcidiopsidaceae cyanobacterium CP_BM_RX_35]|nr:hypothetical protein [Chroococcidiopsidaceae cyanobacterium CP_BM_RX_35]
MQFEHLGMSLWYGTPDAPTPGETVSAGTEIAIVIGVCPIDASNKVELLYRIDRGSTETVVAKWQRNDISNNAQYFRAKLPALQSGETLEYSVICRCAGRQVPAPEDAKQFTNSFKVIGPDSQSGSKSTAQESTRPVDNSSTNTVNETKATNATEVVTPATAESQGNPSPVPNIKSRINTINSVLGDANHQAIVSKAIEASKGDITNALDSLKDKLPPTSLQKATLANSLAVLTADNVAVVKTLTNQSNLTSLRDIALNFDVEKLAAIVDPKTLPETIAGATDAEKKKNFAVTFQHKLFAMAPSAVLQRMVQEAEVPISDPTVRTGVANFLANQPDFNIRTTSIYTALKHPEAFKDIPKEQQAGVVEHLKVLQRVQAISPIPEAVPTLMNANLTSAFRVAEMPETSFLSAYSPELGEEPARQVYTAAINTHIRNEHALITIRESIRGTGLAIIDGQRSTEERLASLQQVTKQQGAPIDLSTLFGSLDYCECDDCQSVYSPASYFVELLQYLRNNNLNPNNPNTGQKGIAGTPLEKLFYRRPDLGCLELTCQNTFTVLPYIDLVNEVMESFIVHLSEYTNSNTDANQREAKLEAFNVEDETTSELLAQPQHINYDAYCILKNTVYPFTLPYHQPIDAIRIFLKYLGTSFCELLDTYRTATESCPNLTLTPAEQQELQKLHEITLDRAVDAEFLGLTQEEYIILTKEAFWPKEYFEITLQQILTDAEYQQKIGVQHVYEYYGYQTEADMLNPDENQALGLTFVKKQFLRRTGILYVDLVELLKTQFINPNYPQGEALTILDSIRFSYRFLQTLVDTSSPDPQIKYAKLIAFLEYAQPLVPLINARLHPDPCHQQQLDWCMEIQDLRNWVYCYFERIGKLIVLDSGEGPQLPIEGQLCGPQAPPPPVITALPSKDIPSNCNGGQLIGTLNKDGTIVDPSGKNIIGNVTITGTVVDTEGQPFVNRFGPVEIIDNGVEVGFIIQLRLQDRFERFVNWLPAQDTCEIDKVRLIHLDGTSLIVDEYDRIHRFIRLWRKMGWTIDETDKALAGLTADSTSANNGTVSIDCNFVSFKDFSEDCLCSENNGNGNCPDIVAIDYDITPDFLHQLVAVRKLLDQTGLPLIKLLTFWANISTAGEKSLYSQLFLTHNLVSQDPVFQADSNGNYLTQSATISDHLPVLMAALNLKADDITAIMKFRKLPDALTLPNLSLLYRHSLLAKTLHVRVSDLPEVIALFGDPFQSAVQTLTLLENWGKMEDAGFTFRQLDYIIRNYDDSLKPLAPSLKKILQLTKTLYDGLNAIDQNNPDITRQDDATADLIRSKAGLLFDQSVVEQIVGFLEGSMVYTMSAPANQTIVIPPSDQSLVQKFKYVNQKGATPPSATIQTTGILTDDERTQAKALSSDADWAKDIDCLQKQALNFFHDILSGIFSDTADAIKNLLVGDVNVPADPNNADATKNNTAPQKRYYFLQHFMPFLRQQLEHRFIVQTLAGATGLANDVTDVLLSDILTTGTTPAITALDNIKAQPPDPANDWKGYLIPPADNSYTFIATSETQPTPITLDGRSISFPYQQECPSDVWSSAPQPLKHSRLYYLEVRGQLAPSTGQSTPWLNWKTPTSPKALIPTSALLPDYSSQGTQEVFIKLYKVAILVNGFNLSADEIGYLQMHGKDFADSNQAALDFNNITLGHWQRLQAYTSLRNSVPRVSMTFLDLFSWVTNPNPDPTNKPDITQLSSKIASITNWNQTNIDLLIQPDHFDLYELADFSNEINLIKLQKALQVADKVAVDINRLFDWAKPGSKFWACHQIAEDIRKAIRARYTEDDWEQVVKPLNDQLREHQKQALISYLLVQKPLLDWGVEDADSLFEFFLIDVQMDACMQTSRIKQALSSVQLFVDRCFLGLEEKYGIQNHVLDRDRWEWMKLYRVWEANREVFCYPENWIDPQLRDDKSQFYTELESELLQKDINTQTIQDALKNYLFKVDEVANMKVVGLFVEEDNQGDQIKIHVFSRTRNAPYFFYYRYFDVNESNWYPWKKVQVDIPSYDLEVTDSSNGHVTIKENGSYLVPVVWHGRPLIFFPLFMKKNAPNPTTNNTKFNDLATQTPDANKSIEYLEIKLGWSEYRNGNWTQKQVSSEAIYDLIPPFDINRYRLAPRIITDPDPRVVIAVFWYSNDSIGLFHFTGSQVFKDDLSVPFGLLGKTDFHYDLNNQIHAIQAVDNRPSLYANNNPYFDDEKTGIFFKNSHIPIVFYHFFVHELLSQLTTGNLDNLFSYYLTITDPADKADAYGGYFDTDGTTLLYNELKRPYAIYNWEPGFHAQMQLADRQLKSNQFEQALKTCQYIFNPQAAGTDDKRFWQFPPFKEVNAENVLEDLFLKLQPDQANNQINEWRDKPFQPHVVARSRPSAYMKYVVMKYIEILIAWGDYLFRQDTIETINQATQLYVLASHIYGPRGQKIPKRGKVQPQTYNSLRDKWDAFGNAMVELELAFPFSNQTPFPIGVSNGVIGLANVFGFASTLYFCIPDNPQLTALRDTIDDRLFKIRHCQNIEGVFQQLPLFDPPIDPGLLVQAAAQGLSLSSVLNDLNSPLPNYRFYYLLQKALELCTELKALGNAFLSAQEKGDGEALSRLRAKHESSIQTLVMEVRKQQLDEANSSLDALNQNRKGPVSRMQYYLQLKGEDLSKVPDTSTDFSDLPNQIEQAIDDSGLKLIGYEKEEMDKANISADLQLAAGITETLASILYVIPMMSVDGKPIGVGAGVAFGGINLGQLTQAVTHGLQIAAGHLQHQSTSAGRKGGFLRQLQERVHLANNEGYEIKNIDKQILTQNIRISIANQEITNQQQQIDNAQEVEDFLRNKYTNQELYIWMGDQLRGLYNQAYTIAYDLAKKAEKVYRFERGLTTSNFIQYGYWNAAYDGLLAGEQLYIGLKQLETAYQEKRGYDFEITKLISLRQINPIALLQLRETGKCDFALPEVLFDMDRPGDYMRRIKSVALTIPCVVGPYTSLNCTLRLLEHKFRMNSIATGKAEYPERTDGTEDRFTTFNIPITSIAVSTGQNDSGVFELNFRDDRYLPFEGAGAISKWHIELPNTFRQFDYDMITDVVMQLRYTAVDGGDKLKSPACGSVQDYIKSVEQLSQQEGLFAAFDLIHDFSNEWYQAMNPPAGATERLLMLNNLSDLLPIFTKGRQPNKIQATDVYLFTPTALQVSALVLAQNTDEYTFTDSVPVGTLKSFAINNIDNLPMSSWQLKIQDVTTEIDSLWLLVRYVLK